LVSKEGSIDIDLLQSLIEGNNPIEFDYCGGVEQKTSKKEKCGT